MSFLQVGWDLNLKGVSSIKTDDKIWAKALVSSWILTSLPLWESLSFIKNSSPEPSWTLKSCGLSIALLWLVILPHNFGSIECVTQAPHGRVYYFQLTKNILKQFFSFYSLLGVPSHLLFKSVFLHGMRYVIIYF